MRELNRRDLFKVFGTGLATVPITSSLASATQDRGESPTLPSRMPPCPDHPWRAGSDYTLEFLKSRNTSALFPLYSYGKYLHSWVSDHLNGLYQVNLQGTYDLPRRSFKVRQLFELAKADASKGQFSEIYLDGERVTDICGEAAVSRRFRGNEAVTVGWAKVHRPGVLEGLVPISKGIWEYKYGDVQIIPTERWIDPYL